MQFLDAKPAALWRILIPRQRWLFTADLPEDELVFHYRQRVYYVHRDGSVVSVPLPKRWTEMTYSAFCRYLAEAVDSYDFDDEGIFDVGSILQTMGFLLPISQRGHYATYSIQLLDTVDKSGSTVHYELPGVDLSFALYHAVMMCSQLNAQSNWAAEYEVMEISQLVPKADFCTS